MKVGERQVKTEEGVSLEHFPNPCGEIGSHMRGFSTKKSRRPQTSIRYCREML